MCRPYIHRHHGNSTNSRWIGFELSVTLVRWHYFRLSAHLMLVHTQSLYCDFHSRCAHFYRCMCLLSPNAIDSIVLIGVCFSMFLTTTMTTTTMKEKSLTQCLATVSPQAKKNHDDTFNCVCVCVARRSISMGFCLCCCCCGRRQNHKMAWKKVKNRWRIWFQRYGITMQIA